MENQQVHALFLCKHFKNTYLTIFGLKFVVMCKVL